MTKTFTRTLLVAALALALALAFALKPTDMEYVDVQAASIIKEGDKKAHKDFSSDVFAGTVQKKVGENPKYTTRPPDSPEGYERQPIAHEQFEVRLTEDVKGKLKAGDTVTVEQAGGPSVGDTVELYEETPRLEVGEEYVLLTRYDEGRKTYNVVAQPDGIVPLADDKAKKLKEYEGL